MHQPGFTGLAKSCLKADPPIYSQALEVSGLCMSVSLILFIKLDFISCANWDGFHKSSRILINFLWNFLLIDGIIE